VDGPPVPDGVLLADKPAGITSHDAVAAERRRRRRGG
jgi:tRNA U55 pseudouridine synthase TruB